MSHLIAKFTVCIALVNGSLIANAEATTHFTNASGFKLVAITNGTGSTSGVIPQIVDPNSAHEPGDDETTGEYVRPIYDTTITRLTMDCGGSTSGVKGSITWAGEWTWSEGGDLTAVTAAVIESSNVTWAPDIPGYDSPDADTLWNNHLAFIHHPNLGAGFHNVTGGSVWEGGRDVFTCDPTNNMFGGGDNWWEPGITGTRFVRL
jgi:hypothetical protein